MPLSIERRDVTAPEHRATTRNYYIEAGGDIVMLFTRYFREGQTAPELVLEWPVRINFGDLEQEIFHSLPKALYPQSPDLLDSPPEGSSVRAKVGWDNDFDVVSQRDEFRAALQDPSRNDGVRIDVDAGPIDYSVFVVNPENPGQGTANNDPWRNKPFMELALPASTPFSNALAEWIVSHHDSLPQTLDSSDYDRLTTLFSELAAQPSGG